MTDFREKQPVEDGQIVSDEEEQTFNRILNSRLKAVPKRKTLTSNGISSTSAENDAGQQTEDAMSGAGLGTAGRLWSDTVLMQSLEDKMGVSAGPGTTIEELRDRGTETYALKKADGKRKRNDDIADVLMDQEEDGMMERQKMDDTDAQMKMERNDVDELPSIAVDSSASLWEGVDTGSAELPTEQSHSRRGKWKRFKKNNRRHQKQTHPWRKPFKKGLKMLKHEVNTTERGGQTAQRQRKMVPPEKFVPHKLLTPNYAIDKLLKTEFDANKLSEEQLAQGLSEALGETMPELMVKAVHFAGKSHAVELFRKCQEVERNGGMLTQSRNRRRTPGGVFMKLFTDSKKIGEEQKKAMHAFSIEKQQQSGGFPKWWEKMKQKREMRAEQAKQTDEMAQNDDNELKELAKSSESIKPSLDITELANGKEAEMEIPTVERQNV